MSTKKEDSGIFDEWGLTAGEYAAIHLRVPNSGTDWLDAMIRESLRTEIAAKIIQSLSTLTEIIRKSLASDEGMRVVADISVGIADALLAELAKGPAK